MTTSRLRVIRFIILVFLYVPLSSGADDTKRRALALVDEALSATNIWIPSNSPFVLRAKVKLFQIQSGSVEGEYVSLWQTPKRWRKSISIPGFSEEGGVRDDKAWEQKSAKFSPLRITQLEYLLAFRHFENEEREQLNYKLHDEKRKNVKLTCIEGSEKDAIKYRLCVDQETHLPSDLEYEDLRYEFADYVAVREQKIPTSIRVFSNSPVFRQPGLLLVDANVAKITLGSVLDDQVLVPPEGAKQAQVFNCQPGGVPAGRKASARAPVYPALAKQHGEVGSVVYGAIIGTDGRIRELTLLQSAGKELDTATREAVQDWRYAPYLCNGVPVEIETTITVNFTLGR